ncbi:MAG: hypothetical protein M1820_009709 [Bogoriella megaspora]|nr:MAG: hypothetical protein M1820_009709 [Bogoriella megaspora]
MPETLYDQLMRIQAMIEASHVPATINTQTAPLLGRSISETSMPPPPPTKKMTNHGPKLPKKGTSSPAEPVAADRPAPNQSLTFLEPNTGFPQFSDSTKEILERVHKASNASKGSSEYEVAREHVLRGMVTSQSMQTPPSSTRGKSSRGGRGRRGSRRGNAASAAATPTNPTTNGAISTPIAMSTPAPTPGPTPASTPSTSRGRGSGRSRGSTRARSRRVGSLGKRKRRDSESSAGSDISASYTPLTTTTKSGRNVQKPTQFAPSDPSPPQGTKRKRVGKRIFESSVCHVCKRGSSPNSNMIVFCDGCNTPYHQYCHDPPISGEVIRIVDKEWFCAPCMRSKEPSPPKVPAPVEAPNASASLSTDQATSAAISNEETPPTASENQDSDSKRVHRPGSSSDINISGNQAKLGGIELTEYLLACSHSTLTSLLLAASESHPDLALFPSGILDFGQGKILTNGAPVDTTFEPINQDMPSTNTGGTGPSNTASSLKTTKPPTATSKLPASKKQPVESSRKRSPSPSLSPPPSDLSYATDPNAHFPKPGNGLYLGPDEDLPCLIDNNYEVFSHVYKIDDGKKDGGGGSGAMKAANAGAMGVAAG